MVRRVIIRISQVLLLEIVKKRNLVKSLVCDLKNVIFLSHLVACEKPVLPSGVNLVWLAKLLVAEAIFI